MTLARHRLNSSECLHVVRSDTFCEDTGLPRDEISTTSTGPTSEGQERSGADGLIPAASGAARWALLDSRDRQVFNGWALRVTAFYSVLIASLLMAIQLATDTPAGRRVLLASPSLERNSPELPVMRTGSISK
jgi:hypothetical protein